MYLIFVFNFREKQPEVIPRLVQTLSRLVADDAPAVAKRALRTSGRILRATLKWVASAPVVTPDMETAWTQLSKLKVQIINMIDSDNDGYKIKIFNLISINYPLMGHFI